MATKLYSTIAGASLIIPDTGATMNVGVTLFKVEFYNQNGSTRYLLAFSGSAVPSNGATPILPPIEVATTAVGTLVYDPGVKIPGPGLVFAISSSKATLTSVADTSNIYVEAETWEMTEQSGTSTVGDYTTGVASRQVWADAAGPKTLFRVEVKETAGAATYILLFSKDSPSNGDIPLKILGQVAANGTLVADFGLGGYSPWDQTAAYVARDGCTIAGSTTAPTLTAVAATPLRIKATYK